MAGGFKNLESPMKHILNKQETVKSSHQGADFVDAIEAGEELPYDARTAFGEMTRRETAQAKKFADWIITEEFTAKLREVLVAKRTKLLERKSHDNSPEEQMLVDWVASQVSHDLPLTGVADDIQLQMAKTLVSLYGDPVLVRMYSEDPMSTGIQDLQFMMGEILLEDQQRMIRKLQKGDFFGEQAFVRDLPRTASVRCTEDCHLAYLDKEAFLRIYHNIQKVKMDRRI